MDEVGAAIDRIVEQEFWPWWFAVAYVQPRAVRPVMLRGAVETFLACSGSEYAQGAAIRRVVEIVADDANLDAAAERAFIDEFQQRLTKPILAGRVHAWGRPDRNAVLHQASASDWVGAEVLTYKTSDLIKAGWLTADPFAPHATKEPIAYYFDLHLRGADVVAVTQDIDRELPSGVPAVEAPATLPKVSDGEARARCDELWLAGHNAYQIEKLIVADPIYVGFKAETLRGWMKGRYKRTGRGERRREHITV